MAHDNSDISNRNGENVNNIEVKTSEKIIRTRQNPKFGGVPSELGTEETCTLREIIQYFYFLKSIHSDIKDSKIHKMIVESVKTVWQKMLPSVPVMTMRTITNKISIVMTKVKKINGNQLKKHEKDLTGKLDKLFDISLCKCSLQDNITCTDR